MVDFIPRANGTWCPACQKVSQTLTDNCMLCAGPAEPRYVAMTPLGTDGDAVALVPAAGLYAYPV